MLTNIIIYIYIFMQMNWSLVSLWEWLSTGRQRAAPCTTMYNWQCTYCTGCLVCLLTSWIAMYITSPCTAMYNWQCTQYVPHIAGMFCLLLLELQRTLQEVWPTGWLARSVQLFALRLTATNNQMHVGGQSCQSRELANMHTRLKQMFAWNRQTDAEMTSQFPVRYS